jgi:chemotaxis signal transduction protein
VVPLEAEAATRRTEPSAASDGLLRFALAGREYALDLGVVEGVADSAVVRPVPGAARGVLGLTEWRGNILTVLDLALLLREGAGPARPCLVRLGPPLRQVALLVAATLRISRACAPESGRPPAEPPVALCSARLREDGLVVHLIDPLRVVGEVLTSMREGA